MRETVRVYFDYLCPFVWRGAEVAAWVAREQGVRFEWHHFSLYQSNYAGEGSWQLWNDPVQTEDEYGGKGLLPFLASCAARAQGEEAFQTFRLRVLRARHQHGQPLTLSTLCQVAAGSGLHLPSFKQDLANPEYRTLLAREHHQAVAKNVFGTPTFHFEGGQLAYFRIASLPATVQEGLELFACYREMLRKFPYLETVKRPRARKN